MFAELLPDWLYDLPLNSKGDLAPSLKDGVETTGLISIISLLFLPLNIVKSVS